MNEKKRMTVYLTQDYYERIIAEKKLSGHNANSIMLIAIDEYLKKKEKERK